MRAPWSRSATARSLRGSAGSPGTAGWRRYGRRCARPLRTIVYAAQSRRDSAAGDNPPPSW
jgi:hypothetical protein